MKKIVKKYGSSHVVVFDPEDLKINNIQEGDVVDLTDMIVIKKGKKK